MAKYKIGDVVYLRKYYYDGLYDVQWFIIMDVNYIESVDEPLYVVLVDDGELHFIGEGMIDGRRKFKRAKV